MKELTKVEETVMIAIWRLKDDAYGVNIKSQIKNVTDREFVYGTLYSTLEQLVSKGYIRKTFGEPTPERGGKRKVFFSVTDPGIDSLKHSFEIRQAVWSGITVDTLGEGQSDE